MCLVGCTRARTRARPPELRGPWLGYSSTTAFPAPTARIRRYGCRHSPRRFSLPIISPSPVPLLRAARQQWPAHQGRPSPGYNHFLQGKGAGDLARRCSQSAQGSAHPWGTQGTDSWQEVVCSDGPGTSHRPVGLVDSGPRPYPDHRAYDRGSPNTFAVFAFAASFAKELRRCSLPVA